MAYGTKYQGSKTMRTMYKVFEQNLIHFVTSTVINRLQIFNDGEIANILLEEFRFRIKNNDLNVYAFVIMPDHFHAILECDNLSGMMRNIKSFSGKKILEHIRNSENTFFLERFMVNDSKYQVWQNDYHPQLIFNDEMFRQKVEYIHNNPIKAGLVENQVDWKLSSAGFYSGNDKILEISVM